MLSPLVTTDAPDNLILIVANLIDRVLIQSLDLIVVGISVYLLLSACNITKNHSCPTIVSLFYLLCDYEIKIIVQMWDSGLAGLQSI